jgi:hypothetical protein
MSAYVLISGQLFRAPEQRTSKAGKPFVTATIRAKDGDDAQWWKVLAFSETVQRDGLVTSKPYRSIFLTEKGQELAKTARERHRVVREFLIALGVDAKTADTDAEGIEHHAAMRRCVCFAVTSQSSAATPQKIDRPVLVFEDVPSPARQSQLTHQGRGFSRDPRLTIHRPCCDAASASAEGSLWPRVLAGQSAHRAPAKQAR